MGIIIINPSANYAGSGLGSVILPKANVFIQAAGITKAAEKNALIQLENDLIAANLRAKISNLYPFVGSTAAAHALNFMNATAADTGNKIVFAADTADLHTAQGYKSNSGNGSYGTLVIPVLSFSNFHLGVYTSPETNANAIIAGGVDNGSHNVFIARNYSSLTQGGVGHTNIKAAAASGYDRTKSGYLAVDRNNLNVNLYDAGTQIGTVAETAMTTIPNLQLGIGCYYMATGGAGQYSSAALGTLVISQSLTAAENLALAEAITTFNNAIGR